MVDKYTHIMLLKIFVHDKRVSERVNPVSGKPEYCYNDILVLDTSLKSFYIKQIICRVEGWEVHKVWLMPGGSGCGV